MLRGRLEQEQVQLAKDAVRNFERLGATYIKIGQVLSVRHVLATSHLPLSWIACSDGRGTGIKSQEHCSNMVVICTAVILTRNSDHMQAWLRFELRRPDVLPVPVMQELARLQDNITPFDTTAARAVVEIDLGQPIDAIFSEFSERPIAAASLAQVRAFRIAWSHSLQKV